MAERGRWVLFEPALFWPRSMTAAMLRPPSTLACLLALHRHAMP